MRFSGFEQMLSHWASATPDAPAIKYERGGSLLCLSYSEFLEKIRARAAQLRGGGKTCLAVLCDGSPDCVVTVFASVLAGMQTVLLDESIPDESLGALLRYTDADQVFSSDASLCGALAPYLTRGVSGGAGRLLFFTSGTTDSSKAVILTDKSLCASAWNGAQMLPLRPEDTLLCMLPLAHVFGFVCGLLWGLSCGACVALGRGARHYVDDCAFFRPTAVSLVPMLLGFLLRQSLLNAELGLILVGAGDCPPTLIEAAAAKGLRVSFGYGLSETSSGVAISVSGDPYAMQVCPDDRITLAEDGEILIEAPTCVMQGYYKRPEDTAAVLSGGVVHTGDLGRFDENGLLHITGRKKEILVLSDGTKLFLPEYEASLSAALKTAELATALLDGRPVLIVTADAPDDGELWRLLRPVMDTLPRGKQIQKIIRLSHPLPRTATGKLKRWQLQTEVEHEQS